VKKGNAVLFLFLRSLENLEISLVWISTHASIDRLALWPCAHCTLLDGHRGRDAHQDRW